VTADDAKYIFQSLRSPLVKVPGPWYTIWTNLPLKIAVMGGRRVHYVHALHQKYGPYVRIAPTEVAVNDLSGTKQIHNINSGFTKTEWYQNLNCMERLGVFAMNNPKEHAVRRRLFARPFSKTHLREHWEATVQERVDLAISRMGDELSSTGITDVMKWWMFMASDVSSQLMFGECFHTLEQGEINEYIRVLQKALMGGGIGAELPWVRWLGARLPLHWTQELFNCNNFLLGYGRAAVDHMKAEKGGKNIFANMLAESEKGEKLDEIDVQIEATNLIVAGTDTTAVTLTYLVWAVLSHPTVERELQDELASLPNGYKDAELEALPLLNAVIEETLRLYGAAPGMLPRKFVLLEFVVATLTANTGLVPKGGVTLGEYYLPENSITSTQSYSLHRDSDLFPDSEKFIPSRWLQSPRVETKYRLTPAAKAAFNPFGIGSRTCLGVHLAYMELRLAAAKFFRYISPVVRLAPSANAQCMEMENYFLIAPAGHKCEIMTK